VVNQYCQTGAGGYRTGYYVYVYQDLNPYSNSAGNQYSVSYYWPGTCTLDPDWQFRYTYCDQPNGVYSGYIIYVYEDVNPYTANGYTTYSYWDPNSCHSTNPIWQVVGTSCDSYGGMQNGWQTVTYYDTNPYTNYGYTTTSSYQPGACTPACEYTCYGQGYKCVNGACEMGTMTSVGSVYREDGWHCVFRYYWSDGSSGQEFEESSGGWQSVCNVN